MSIANGALPLEQAILNEALILGHVECRTVERRNVAALLAGREALTYKGRAMSQGGRGWSWYVRGPRHPGEVVGPDVWLTKQDMGASEASDLTRTVRERFEPGTPGRIVFAHPNVTLAAEWFYVEVHSRLTPTRRLYVGATLGMVTTINPRPVAR